MAEEFHLLLKGMLLHSRNKTTEKELSDINLLVDESLALAFHGKKSTEADFYCHIEKIMMLQHLQLKFSLRVTQSDYQSCQ